MQSVKRNAYEAAPKLWRVTTLVGDGQAAVVDGEGPCLFPLSAFWEWGLGGKEAATKKKIMDACCAHVRDAWVLHLNLQLHLWQVAAHG